ncbi:MAG: NAD(P)H-hydrate dehydratase, partial [Rhodospirillaceae bacterium]
GPRMIGAACLAGQAARRVGAGLLSIAGSALSLGPALASAPGLMLWDRQRDGDLPVLLADPRRNAVLVGPGRGRGEAAEGDVCQEVRLATEASAALVLDADALMAFADDPDALFALLRARGGRLGPSGLAVLTPHDGEFVALFGPDGEHDRLEATRAAAKQAQAVVLRKGPVSIIAEPTHGHAVINREDNPDLATAGSGDVLAGAVLGLLTQGADPMTAAVAANRIHRHAARLAGPLAGGGMIAEDLLERLGQASAAERSHL